MSIPSELSDVLHTHASARGVPGSVLGVLADGERHVASYGVTSVENPLPVTPQTLFQVASITKTFTATAVMLLVADGKLGLEDSVAKHAPDLGDITGLDTEQITIEHTLSHQAGFDGDHLLVTRIADLAALRNARHLFTPGTGYSYSNAGFSIAGAVIEAVTGEPFDRFVRHRLLKPLGMRSACFTADDAITHRVAMPHFVHGEHAQVIRRSGWQPGWELTPTDRAAGGLVLSADHLLAWAQFHFDGRGADGSQLLALEHLERLHAPVVNVDTTEDCALDWSVKRHGDETTLAHGGLTAGYCLEFTIVPAARVGIVSLTNATTGGPVNDATTRWALERFAGVRVADPIPDPAIAVDPASYTGTFLAPFAKLTVEVGEAPATLLVRSEPRDDVDGWKPPVDPPVTLGLFAPDHAVTVGGVGAPRVVRVGLDGNGRAAWLQWNSRRALRLG